nr:reverse transcriptase domain-containing protein [Tanacetum cinerariifolium]
MRLNLDLLQERRETAAIREARYKTKIEQYYNKKVRPSGFRLGEFVFQRNKASGVEDQGKLGPKWEGLYKVVEAYENGSYKLQTLDDKEVHRTWHAINIRGGKFLEYIMQNDSSTGWLATSGRLKALYTPRTKSQRDEPKCIALKGITSPTDKSQREEPVHSTKRQNIPPSAKGMNKGIAPKRHYIPYRLKPKG